jgi:hypothetical protein
MEDFRSDAGVTDFPGLEQGAQITVRRLFGHPCGDRDREAVPPLQGCPAANSADEVDQVVHELRLYGRAHDQLPLWNPSMSRRDPPVGGRNERDAGQAPHPPKEPYFLRLSPHCEGRS